MNLCRVSAAMNTVSPSGMLFYKMLEPSNYCVRIIEHRSKEADMKPTVIALTLTALSVIWGPTASTFAADKVAKGTISAIGGQSLTVKVGDQNMVFNVDAKTVVTAPGAATKATQLAAPGKPGPHLKDVLQSGQAVAVTYTDMGIALHASAIKAIPKASASPNPNADMHSAGIVKALGADWITINGKSGGGASFEQTFKVDPKTKVFAKGAGTATAATGGRGLFDQLVASGDHVRVSYHKNGADLFASDVHVTVKAAAH